LQILFKRLLYICDVKLEFSETIDITQFVLKKEKQQLMIYMVLLLK